MFDTAKEALQHIAANDTAMVDLKMVSVSGHWLHVTIPAQRFTHKHFEEGVGYDGSSGPGFGKVENGDVAALPQPSTAFVDPFRQKPTMGFLCDIVKADAKELCPSDQRTIAKRAVEHMRRPGIADEAWMGPQFAFHVFDRADVANEPYDTSVSLRAAEVHLEGAAAPTHTNIISTSTREQLIRSCVAGEMLREGGFEQRVKLLLPRWETVLYDRAVKIGELLVTERLDAKIASTGEVKRPLQFGVGEVFPIGIEGDQN